MRCLNCRANGIRSDITYCLRCGVHLPSLLRDVLPNNTMLHGGRYCIDYALGRGGFGITYRSSRIDLGKLVAIKEYYPQDYAWREGLTLKAISSASKENFSRGLEKFIEEGEILGRIEHPHVVQVQSQFEENGTAYLVMELLHGDTLGDLLKQQPDRKLAPERVKELLTPLVESLAITHKQGIYHLDIKPDNILIEPDGRLVLIDFGAAKQKIGVDQARAGSSQAFTLDYVPPEVIAKGKVGAASDVYEFGMMAHEMLTGKLPPNAYARTMGTKWRATEVPQQWRTLLDDALQVQRASRPQYIQVWWEKYFPDEKKVKIEKKEVNSTVEPQSISPQAGTDPEPDKRLNLKEVNSTVEPQSIPPQAGTDPELDKQLSLAHQIKHQYHLIKSVEIIMITMVVFGFGVGILIRQLTPNPRPRDTPVPTSISSPTKSELTFGLAKRKNKLEDIDAVNKYLNAKDNFFAIPYDYQLASAVGTWKIFEVQEK